MERSSKVEMERRLATIREWILADYTYTDIISSAVIRFEVCERQAERYYSKAFQSFKSDNQQTVEHQKAYYKAKKLKLIRDMYPEAKKTPRGVTAINKILDSMAKLDGIMIDKVEVSGPNGEPLQNTHVIVLPSNNRDANT